MKTVLPPLGVGEIAPGPFRRDTSREPVTDPNTPQKARPAHDFSLREPSVYGRVLDFGHPSLGRKDGANFRETET